MTTKLLPCVEIEPAQRAQRSVIWLHGLGADGHDFEPIVPHLGLDPELAVRFVFPHAPSIPVTINGGMRMPAWYDIRVLESARGHDMSGALRSAEHVRGLIEREHERGVAPRNIVLAGFSQGGAIATYVALRHAQPLCGLVALSTYLIGGERLDAEASPANRGLPCFVAHGEHDPMVSLARGEELRAKLEELGHPVVWKRYAMQHQVCAEEIEALGAWLSERFAASER